MTNNDIYAMHAICFYNVYLNIAVSVHILRNCCIRFRMNN